jgi:acetoin utilization deacetylase AcuC-like enzyme
MCDPFAVMAVTSPGFARMARIVLDVAEEVCHGRLVLIHEGGYSSAHVPFCGVAVVEELLGEETRIDDPFTEVFRAMAYMDLQPHQDEAIRRAEENLEAIPAATRVP